MELRHLRYFITVAEELNFSRAAERLHMAQPPLSQQIRQLETELGFRLFDRNKRSVKLTEAGQVFLDEAYKLFQNLDRAIQLGQQTSRGELGQLTIGFASSVAHSILPTLIKTFRTNYPHVTLELRELTTDLQLQWLQQGRIDIGFVRPPVEADGVHHEVIFWESPIVALPEGHPLGEDLQVSLRSLAREPFILFPRSAAPGLYDPIVDLCQQAGFRPQVAQEALQMQTIISLVAANMGVAIVPASMRNLQRSGVVYKSLEEATPTLATIAVIWRSIASPIVQRFLAVARSGKESSKSPSY
jgi:DNA-binding transcriptional LysR family regulator